MSAADVELLRRSSEAENRSFEHGDVASWVAEFFWPDAVWEEGEPGTLPGEGPWRGHGGIGEFFEDNLATYPDYFRIEPEEFIDAGELVLVAVKLVVRSPRVAGFARFIRVVRVRNRKIAHVRVFRTPRLALAAAGLDEAASATAHLPRWEGLPD
jgi:ketosteroid isomerase-like protein